MTKTKIRADAKAVVKLGTFTDYLFGYATQEGIIFIYIIGHLGQRSEASTLSSKHN